MSFEACMSSERVFGPSLPMTDELQLVSAIFEPLWRVDEAAPFARLLRKIDDAIVQHRCRARIARLHRMLERNYPR
jgi:hypothetical protein